MLCGEIIAVYSETQTMYTQVAGKQTTGISIVETGSKLSLERWKTMRLDTHVCLLVE